MPITHFFKVSNFLDELATALETLFITCSDFTYLSREEKCENYGHTPILQALTTVTVPVTEPGAGPGTGLHWWFRYRIALVVPVPVPDCTGGSGTGTGLHWWFR